MTEKILQLLLSHVFGQGANVQVCALYALATRPCVRHLAATVAEGDDETGAREAGQRCAEGAENRENRTQTVSRMYICYSCGLDQ